MQVDSWLPAQVLPFAAASRPAIVQVVGQAAPTVASPRAEAAATVAAVPPASAIQQVRAGLEPAGQAEKAAAQVPAVEAPAAVAPRVPPVAVPRFSLQLYRAGACLLLVELPTGEALQSRDPAYLLLKDLLRAAGLPDSPQLLGEPVRWPLLAGGNLIRARRQRGSSCKASCGAD